MSVLRFLLSLALALPSAALAGDPTPETDVFVDQLIQFSGHFADAELVLQWDGGSVQVVPAFAIEEQHENGGLLRVAARMKLPQNQSAQHASMSFALIDSDGQRSRTPVEEVSLTELRARTLTIDKLRDFVGIKRDELRLAESQLKLQEATLDRLRADAEVIGRLKSLVRLKEEVDANQRSLDFLKRDQDLMEEFIRVAKSRPNPVNMNAREAQLTRATSELAERAKRAEAAGQGSRTKLDQDLQAKLKLAESTRAISLEALEREVTILRKRLADRARPTAPVAAAEANGGH